MSLHRSRIAATAIVSASLLVGLTVSSSSIATTSDTVADTSAAPDAVVETDATTAATVEAAPAPCPNPDGGPQNHCLGPLEPGEYTTAVFEPTLTYSVPAGWANMEDLPGNFLLVPPGGDLAGVNPMTSDFIGVYSSVAAPEICSDDVDNSVDRSAAAMVEWMQQQPALVVSEPLPVSVGGLDGLQIDVALSESEACADPSIADSYALVIIGVGPSHLTHGVVPGYLLRVMLLDTDDGVLAVELADAPDGGSDFDDWWTAAADITETFDFTT